MDAEIWEYAKKNGYILVSRDADFYDRLLMYGFPPKLIWLTGRNASTRAICAALKRHVGDVVALMNDPDQGCIEIHIRADFGPVA